MYKVSYLLVLLTACSVSKKTKMVHPFVGDQIGCGNFIVYQLSEDNKEYISIAFNAAEVELKNSQTYGIGKAEILAVNHRRYESEINASLCNDIKSKLPKEVLSERANAGLVEIQISDLELIKAEKKEGYRVTILLKNVTFENTKIDLIKIDNIYIGWLPG